MELSDGSKVCLDCEAVFIIDDGERKYFEANNLTLPKRCKDCRAQRKALASAEAVRRATAELDEVIRREDEDFIVLMEG